MKFPSKITSYKESVLSKFPVVLTALASSNVGVLELYRKTSQNFANIEEFMDTLDCLFALGKIEYDLSQGGILHVI